MAGYVTPTSPRLHLPGQSVLVFTFHPGLVFFSPGPALRRARPEPLGPRTPPLSYTL